MEIIEWKFKIMHLLDLRRTAAAKNITLGLRQESQGRRLDFYCQRPIVVFFAAGPG